MTNPIFTQRLDDRRIDNSFDIGARRVMRSQTLSFIGVQRLLEKSAEYSWLQITPICIRRVTKQTYFALC